MDDRGVYEDPAVVELVRAASDVAACVLGDGPGPCDCERCMVRLQRLRDAAANVPIAEDPT